MGAQRKEKVWGWILLCQVCREPQKYTPSGLVCKNGHGGAPSTNVPAVKIAPLQKEPS